MFLLKATKLRKNLLAYVFTHVDGAYYVRELAGLINDDPGNLSRELASLEKEGLFVSSKKGNLKLYSLNKAYPLFDELKNVVSKTEGVVGSLRELVGCFKGIELAFIYGSYATGKEKESSDIDLFIVGDLNEQNWVEALNTVERKLNREINYVYFDPVEFKKKMSDNGKFIHSVTKGKMLMLKGDLNAR
jgi:predicted nucleotidyltransferase